MSERATLSQAYRQGLAEEMRTDPRILVYGTDLFERGGHWGQVRGLGSEFGRDRVRNAPISEAAMVASPPPTSSSSRLSCSAATAQRSYARCTSGT